jgi:hypothetical protein
MLIMMATAKAVSAAATAMMKMEYTIPWSISGYRYLLITTKFTTEEFRINSTEMRIEMRFFRVMNPYTPMKNRMEVRVRISVMLTPGIIFSEIFQGCKTRFLSLIPG